MQVPARGQLRLDFVHQRLPDDVDASLPQEGLEALLRLINRSLGSGSKLDCLRQVREMIKRWSRMPFLVEKVF